MTSQRILIRVLVALSLLSLAACGEEWSITKIQVNEPDPLGPTGTVIPVVLIAPTDIGVPASKKIPVRVTVQRISSYTGQIFLQSRMQFTRPNQSNFPLTLGLESIAAGQTQKQQTLLQVFCRRTSNEVQLLIARPPAPSASAPPTGPEVSFLVISGSTSATTSVNVLIDSGKQSGNFQIGRPADKLLQISCQKEGQIN